MRVRAVGTIRVNPCNIQSILYPEFSGFLDVGKTLGTRWDTICICLALFRL